MRISMDNTGLAKNTMYRIFRQIPPHSKANKYDLIKCSKIQMDTIKYSEIQTCDKYKCQYQHQEGGRADLKGEGLPLPWVNDDHGDGDGDDDGGHDAHVNVVHMILFA